MPQKSNKKKPPKDINQLAAYIVRESTKESQPEPIDAEHTNSPRPQHQQHQRK